MKTLDILSEKGYYGEYGGAYIPELLFNNIDELEQNYLRIINSASFLKEYNDLLANYVGRPTPLYLAKNISEKFNAKIYLKREDLCHTGAHKINNTIGQILVAKALGKKRILAETGAGQHGVATATVCALLKLECIVYMGEVDMKRQEANVARMKMLGATIIPAISGSKTLKDATNEAIRGWINDPEAYYLIGSVVGPHPYPDMVSRFQSVISKEIKQQLLKHEGISEPDIVIACVGGGSNAAGAFYEFINSNKTKLIGVEAGGKGITSGHSAATMAIGTTGILHGSRSVIMQTPEGQVIEPYSISAGLDYPGIGPLHAFLGRSNKATYINVTDDEAIAAAFELTKEEGIIPALESAHALAALHKIGLLQDQVVVVNLSGRGDKDLPTYLNYLP
jgi:tryptophan synthase beta subunit